MTANGRPFPFISLLAVFSFLWLISLTLRADQIEMQNGDRYVGRLLAYTNDTLVIQSDVLGTVRLPRAKVASVTIGTAATTNVARAVDQTNHQYLASQPPNNTSPGISAALGTSANSNIAKQVQQQFLSSAGPEANQKFTEMAEGLLSGKLNVDDIRAQAAAAADQLRKLKHDSGDDVGALDGYLTILDNFLRETAPANRTATNVPAQKLQNSSPKEEE